MISFYRSVSTISLLDQNPFIIVVSVITSYQLYYVQLFICDIASATLIVDSFISFHCLPRLLSC